ncbi:MAG: methyl-accepting chemotaxis protein [Pseudomonadota bacterium]
MRQRFEDWILKGSIQSQTGRVFNLIALVVIILGAIGTIGTFRIEQRSAALSDVTDVAFLTANMNRQITLAKDNMGAYRARGYDAETIALGIEQARSVVEMNQELRQSAGVFGPDYLAKVSAIDANIRKVEGLLVEVRDAPLDVVEKESFLGPRYDALDTTIAQVVVLREEAAERVGNYSGEGQVAIQSTIIALVAGVIIALGLVILARTLVSRRVIEPIADISGVSERIALGETELVIPWGEREDEIGQLSSSLSVLRSVQQDAAEQARNEHKRELQRQREIEAEREASRSRQAEMLKSLAENFEQSVADVAHEVASTSDQMCAAADELTRTVDASSNTVSEANANLKQASDGITGAAAATDEFSLSINEVSRQATSSSERAQRAAQAAHEADKTIAGLTASADEISQIVEVIAGIAQRTNLLALNASIEAARGGETGRGFAVVASEVKELASQTGKATEEVERLIREMQSATDNSASALSRISEEVVALESTATVIASAVDQQAIASQDLAQSIDLAARNTQTVSSTIDEVSTVSRASGATAAQVLESSSGLSTQARILREQVGKFLDQVRAA